MKDRYLTKYLVKDLKEKMVFVAGPRQVGKTYLAQYLGKKYFSAILISKLGLSA